MSHTEPFAAEPAPVSKEGIKICSSIKSYINYLREKGTVWINRNILYF